MIEPLVVKAAHIVGAGEVVALIVAQATDNNTAIAIAAIGSVTSVLLASIAAGVSIWNNRIAARTEETAKRTEHTVNSRTDALTDEIVSLKALVVSKDETIAAQQAPAYVAPDAPRTNDPAAQ